MPNKLTVSLQSVADQKQFENNTQIQTAVSYLLGQEINIPDTGVGANTEFAVTHSLGRKASNIQLLIEEANTNTAYVQIRPSGTAWTTSVVYLKCSVANANLTIRVS